MASSGGGRQRVRSSRRRSARQNRPNKSTDTRSAYGRTSTDPSENQHIRVVPESEAKRGQTFAGVVAAAATGSTDRGRNRENSSKRATSPFFIPQVPAQAVPSSGKPTFADKLKTQLPVEVQTDRKDPRTFVKPKTGEKRQAQLQPIMETKGENTKPVPMKSSALPTLFSKVAAYPQQVQPVSIASPRPRPQVAVPDSWENLSQVSSPTTVLSSISDRRMNEQQRSQPPTSARYPASQPLTQPTEPPQTAQNSLSDLITNDFGMQDLSAALQDLDEDIEEQGYSTEYAEEDEGEISMNESDVSVSLSASQASEFLFGGEAGLEKLAKKNIPITQRLSVSSHHSDVHGMVETEKGKFAMNLGRPDMESYLPSSAPTPRPNLNGTFKPPGAEDYSETRSFWEEMNRLRDQSNRMEETRQQQAEHPTGPRKLPPMEHHQRMQQHQPMMQNPLEQYLIENRPMAHPYHQGPPQPAPYDPDAERFFRLRHRTDAYTRLENMELASMHLGRPVVMVTENERKQLFDYRNHPDHFGLSVDGHGGFGHEWMHGIGAVKAAGHGAYFPHLLNFQDQNVQPPPPHSGTYQYEGYEYVPPGIGGRLGDPLHPDYMANVQQTQQRQEQAEAQRMGTPLPPPGFSYMHYGQAFDNGFHAPGQRLVKTQPKVRQRYGMHIPTNEYHSQMPEYEFAVPMTEEKFPQHPALDGAEDSSGEESSIHMDDDEMDKFTQEQENNTAGKLVFKQRHSQMARTHDAPLITNVPTRQPKGPKIGSFLTPEEARREWSQRRGKGGAGRRL